MELDYIKLRDIKPVLSGYLHESLIVLKEAEVPDEKAIHDIRVLMKKTRSILKLAGPQLDNGYNDRDAESLKKVGQITRRWRETSVLRKLLRDFKKENPEIFARLSDNADLNKILGKIEVLSDAPGDLSESTSQINSLITKTSYRIRFQQMHTINPQILIKELDITYRKVVDVYVTCRNNPKSDSLHKFRKRTKDFLYQY